MASLISPLTSGAIDAALNSLIDRTGGAGIAGNADEPRQAMTFTSKMRRALLSDTADRIDAVRSQQTSVNDQNANNQIFDLNSQLDRAMPIITMEVNPSSVEFDQPKRYSRQDTMNGTVFHHFTNSKGQNNDILTLRFRGNTGNISRRGRNLEDRDRAIQRLEVWHNLYQLTREPMLLSDGTTNTFTISYWSALFPVQLDFEGFFTRVLTFTEDARKPNSREYSMEFIVQKTSPDLNTAINNILDFVTQQAVALPSDDATVLTR